MSRLYKKPPRQDVRVAGNPDDALSPTMHFDRGVLTQVKQGQGKTNWQVRDRLQSDLVALRAHVRRSAAQRETEAAAQARTAAIRSERGIVRGTAHRPTNPLNSGAVPTPPPSIPRPLPRPWLVPERERFAAWQAAQAERNVAPAPPTLVIPADK